MSAVVPNEWTEISLAEVATVRVDRVDPLSLEGTDYLGLEHVEAQVSRVIGAVPANTMKSSCLRFSEGDVLYGRLRPYLNKVAKPAKQGVCSPEFIVFAENDALANDFLRYRLNASDAVRFASQLNAGDRPRVDFDQLSGFRFSLPPVAEQKRIGEKIDELFSDLDAGVAALQRAQANMKRYRASVLKAAVEGRLTAEWRQDNPPGEAGTDLLARLLRERRGRWEAAQLAKFEASGQAPPKDWRKKYVEPGAPDTSKLPALPAGWCWASVDQLSVVVRGASPRPAGDPRYFGGDVPWITVGSLTADEGMYLDRVDQFVTLEGKEASRFIDPDSLLLTNSGATLGVPKITRLGGCINDGSVALLELNDELQRYLYWFLRTQTKSLRSLNQGAAQPNLNTDIVRRIVVPLPSLDEMERISSLVGEAIDLLRSQESGVGRMVRQASALRQSILKHAFTGKLVPQDPSDEPASLLLERIRATRSARPALPKTRRVATKKAKSAQAGTTSRKQGKRRGAV